MDVSRRHQWFPRRNDALEKSAERVTTQIWVALLIGRSRGNFASTNQKHYPDLGSDASSVWSFALTSQSPFPGETSSGIAKCQLFSQARRRWDCKKQNKLETLFEYLKSVMREPTENTEQLWTVGARRTFFRFITLMTHEDCFTSDKFPRRPRLRIYFIPQT